MLVIKHACEYDTDIEQQVKPYKRQDVTTATNVSPSNPNKPNKYLSGYEEEKKP
jgi:hypothetical protein